MNYKAPILKNRDASHLRDKWAQSCEYYPQKPGTATGFFYPGGAPVLVGDLCYCLGGFWGCVYREKPKPGGEKEPPRYNISLGGHITLSARNLEYYRVVKVGNALEFTPLFSRARQTLAGLFFKTEPLFAFDETARRVTLSKNYAAVRTGRAYSLDDFTADVNAYFKRLAGKRRVLPKGRTGRPIMKNAAGYFRAEIAREPLERLRAGVATAADLKKIADCANLYRPVVYVTNNREIINLCEYLPVGYVNDWERFIDNRDGVFIGNLPPTVAPVVFYALKSLEADGDANAAKKFLELFTRAEKGEFSLLKETKEETADKVRELLTRPEPGLN